MDYTKLARLILKKLDLLSVIEIDTPFTARHLELVEEVHDLIDIFTSNG